MKVVAPLRYDVIFKKAFCDPDVFMGFVRDTIGVQIEISKVETEKTFSPLVGRVASRFDLFAEDTKNRVIVDIQHTRHEDHYDAFLHYHCAAILEQVIKAENYRPKLAVYSIIVLTKGDPHKVDWAMIDFDPKTRKNKGLKEIPHKVIYLCPKYVNKSTPEPLSEWLRAIDDTLDKEVDENQYANPLIRRVFDLIENDSVSPEERARMFEENNQEKLKQKEISEAKIEGKRESAIEIARSLLAEQIPIATIAKVTHLRPSELAALQGA